MTNILEGKSQHTAMKLLLCLLVAFFVVSAFVEAKSPRDIDPEDIFNKDGKKATPKGNEHSAC